MFVLFGLGQSLYLFDVSLSLSQESQVSIYFYSHKCFDLIRILLTLLSDTVQVYLTVHMPTLNTRKIQRILYNIALYYNSVYES